VRRAASGLIIGFLILSSISAACAHKGASPALSVIMATDKSRYGADEVVRLKITNNLDVSLWYIGFSLPGLSFWQLESARGGNWQDAGLHLPLIDQGVEVCRFIMLERPVGSVTELQPASDLEDAWNQKTCVFRSITEPTEPERVEKGRYRFVLRYSLETVKTEKPEAEPWKRPVELGRTTVVYSNEFVLE
jgi:hypothetical protein